MDMYSVVKENPILAILRNIPLEYTVDYAQAIVDGGISFFDKSRMAIQSSLYMQNERMYPGSINHPMMMEIGTSAP